MTMDLFIQPSVVFEEEKTANEVALPEDPNMWPQELLQELYKQVPYAADFQPHVNMERVDAERGYAFGAIEVQNKTEAQAGTDPASMDAAGIKNARIPVIVKDRKLQPLDLVLSADNRVLPLTEGRLRQVLFRPQAFDITGRSPGDMSLIGQLYPPFRQNYGFGGGGMAVDAGGLGKMGSVLERILPTINESDYQSLFDKLAADKGLQAQFVAHSAFCGPALSKLAEFTPKPVTKLAEAIYNNLKPTVVQLRVLDEGYSMKVATHNMWSPEEKTISRADAIRLLGEKVVLAADLSGSATMAEGADTVADDPTEDAPELISTPGTYKVKDTEGRELVGIVIPNLIDIDGRSLPICLFTNGSQKAVQGDIAGVRVGEASNLPEGDLWGFGCFYAAGATGKVKATVPMTIKGSSAMNGLTTVSAETFDGRPVEVHIVENASDLQCAEGAIMVPSDWSWLAMDKAQDVELQSDPAAIKKTANAANVLRMVELRSAGGDSFSIDGLPVDKLASSEKHFLDLDGSMFLLAALGVESKTAAAKLGQAVISGAPVDIMVGRTIETAAEKVAEAKKSAAAFLTKVPNLRRDLVKEAAVIPDPTAVDTLLSLGFLNPENLGAFVSYLPAIDSAQQKMCELLLAARLGMREIPTSALERAIRAVEEVIEGLRVLAFESTS